jgi:hypothetical protein
MFSLQHIPEKVSIFLEAMTKAFMTPVFVAVLESII